MLRPFLVLVTCLLISQMSTAQTKEQIDSIREELLKVIKNTPPPPDSVLRKLRMADEEPRVPDTLHFSNIHAYEVKTFPSIFERAFFKGAKTVEDSMELEFYSVDIGMIQIESGKIIAGDPIVVRDMRPFIQTFPIGKFPVQLAIARFRGDERTAFSRIYFSRAPVVKWEFALDSGKKQMPIGGERMYGYGVDGGIGLFIDAKANQAFSALRASDEDLWEKVFIRGMHQHSDWEYTVYQFGDHNLASFSTGMGDGSYATYVGYDAKGRLCRLLTDFGLIGWWKRSGTSGAVQ